MSDQSYILLVERQPDDAAFILSLFSELADPSIAGVPIPSVRVVQTLEEATRIASSEPGCAAVLLDTHLLARVLQHEVQRGKVETALLERALNDGVTGLPRHPLLLDRLGVAMKRCTRDGSSGALLFVELNGLQQISRAHGHAMREAVLRAAAARLTGLVRGSDTVARGGGDGFCVLLPNESGLLETLAIGEKLLKLLAEPLAMDGSDLELSAAIGVVRFRDASEAPEAMVQRGDAAMHAAAPEGKGRVRML